MIRIYTIPECPYCTELKEMLKAEGLEYNEVNVNLPESQAEYDELFKITKSNEVPIVKIGKQLLVPNVSFHSIREAADLTKKIIG